MKKVYFLMIALGALALSACSAIEDAATIKVPVPDFAINLSAPVSAATRAATNFSGSQILSINDPQFSAIKDYIDVITDIIINQVTVTITNSGSSGTGASNITLSATGVTPNVTIANYTFGTPYSGDAALKTFLKNVILQLKNGVTVSISGTTDVPSGETLSVSIALSGVEVWAKTIKF